MQISALVFFICDATTITEMAKIADTHIRDNRITILSGNNWHGMRCFASKYNRTGCNLYANAEGCVVLIGLPGVVSMKARP